MSYSDWFLEKYGIKSKILGNKKCRYAREPGTDKALTEFRKYISMFGAFVSLYREKDTMSFLGLHSFWNFFIWKKKANEIFGILRTFLVNNIRILFKNIDWKI